MKRLVLGVVVGGIVGAVLILLVMALFEKNRNHHNGLRLVANDTTTAVSNIKHKQILVYGEYLHLDSADYMLIPIGMKVPEKENKVLGSDASEIGGNYNRSIRNYKYNFYTLDFDDCNNIIFYNKKSHETHLILQQPAIISQFYFPFYDKEYTDKRFYFILLGIREYDTNADGYINDDDAERLYISDLAGKNLVQITPDKTQLVDWDIDMKARSILMKVRFDSNNDEKFNQYDEMEILKTSIDSASLGEEILSKEIKVNIKRILNKVK